MIHEIINPSDPYTIECNDMALLTASVFFLGEGRYGTTSEDTDFKVPITVFGGDGAAFFIDTFGISFGEYAEKNKSLISDCLSTVCLGSIDDRKTYLSALNKIDDKIKKKLFIDEWYDRHQTSLNLLGQRAYALSEHLKD